MTSSSNQMNMNPQVSQFLDEHEHPYRREIDMVRRMVLDAHTDLEETVKWNGPNFSIDGKDRFSLKIFPPKDVTLVLHCGTGPSIPRENRLIDNDFGLLNWKTTDRAFVSLKDQEFIHRNEEKITTILRDWITAAG